MMQRHLLLLGLLAGALAATACRETTANPDFCQCDGCVISDGGACTHRDAGPDAGDAGDGGGDCALTCLAPNVCTTDDRCVPCYEDDDAVATDPGCVEPNPVCSNETECVACADTGDVAPHPGCAEPTPVCSSETECARCIDRGDAPHPGCDDATPFCLDGDTCGACRTSADCVDGDQPICDPVLHTCRVCNEGIECGDAGLGLACLGGGTCAECDDSDDCDPHGCDPRTNECSLNGARSVGQCLACVSDLDCSGGRVCVVVEWDGAEVGTYCAIPDCDGQGDPDFWCSGTEGRGNSCQETVARDGRSVHVCIPATTTCEAYRNHREACVGVQGICSHDGDGGDSDGVCVGGGCTYPCETSQDCPGGFECSDEVPGNCDVN